MKRTLALLSILAAGPALRAETPAETVQKFAPQLASANLEEKLAARDAIQAAGALASRPGAEAERLAYAKAAAGFFAPSNPQPARVWLARMLGLFGGEESVAPLAGLLREPDAELRDAARRALQANPSPKAAEALRAALAAAKDPLAVRGLMDGLAYRADTGAVDAIEKRLSDSDAAVAGAAALALGKIGDPRAVAALDAARAKASGPLKAQIESALLDAQAAGAKTLDALAGTGSNHAVRAGALARLLLADPAAGKSKVAAALKDKDPKVAAAALRLAADGDASLKKAAIDALPALPPALQAVAATVLGEAGVKEAAPALKQLLGSADETARIAAATALGRIAGADAIDLLLERLASGAKDEQAAAERAIAVLRDPAADARLLSAAKKGSSPAALAAIRAIASRNPAGGSAALLSLAQGADAALRDAALDALKAVGSSAELKPLIDMVAASADAKVRAKAQAAAAAIASRAADPAPVVAALQQALAAAASPANKAELLAMLPSAPAPAALAEAVQAFADPDAAVRDAALRALSAWPDFAAAAPLLKIAKETTPDNKHHVLAFRGIAKMLGLEKAPAADRVQIARDALAAARRPDEKKLIVAALADVKHNNARKLLQELSNDPAIGKEAAAALAKAKK